MRAAWSAAAVVVAAIYALACSSPPKEDESESTAAPLTSQARLKATTYLDQQSSAWAAKDDWSFVQGGRCVMSCHTTVPFVMVRSKLPASVGTSTLATIRGYVEQRVNDWSNAAPLYSWVSAESRGTEAVVNAFALVSIDAPTGALSRTASAALAAMWQEQQSDGSFAWWDSFSLAPWENGDAGLWGAALADLAVGLAPSSYVSNLTPAEQTKLARLEGYLLTRASDAVSPPPLNNRAMILLAATRRATLLPDTVKKQIANAVRALQAADGSWSASSLGFQVAGGTTAQASAHAYATAFYTYVLAETGDTSAAARGRTWLEGHQRADGAWEAKSLNRPTVAFNNQQMTDAATAYAMMALTP